MLSVFRTGCINFGDFINTNDMLWEDLTPLVAFSLPSSMQSEYADPLEYYNQPIEHVEDQIQAQQLNISLYSPQLNCPETQYWCPTPVSELGTDRTTPVSEVGCGTDHTTPGYDVGCGTGLPTLGTEIGYSRDLIIPGSEVGCGTGHTTPGSEIGCGTGRTTPGSEKGCGSGLRVPTPARVATPPGLVIDVEVHLPQSPGQWETFDYDLAVATLKAEAEGTKTPLIKNELRYCIQRKRKASGLDELQVEYKEEGQQQVMHHIRYLLLPTIEIKGLELLNLHWQSPFESG